MSVDICSTAVGKVPESITSSFVDSPWLRIAHIAVISQLAYLLEWHPSSLVLDSLPTFASLLLQIVRLNFAWYFPQITANEGRGRLRLACSLHVHRDSRDRDY